MEIVPGDDGPMMVVFLAHWCPHCNDEIPVVLEWRDSGAIPDDLQVVGVSTAVSAGAAELPARPVAGRQGLGLADHGRRRRTHRRPPTAAPAFPFFVVVGADGTVKARTSGELPVEQLDALVGSLDLSGG